MRSGCRIDYFVIHFEGGVLISDVCPRFIFLLQDHCIRRTTHAGETSALEPTKKYQVFQESLSYLVEFITTGTLITYVGSINS